MGLEECIFGAFLSRILKSFAFKGVSTPMKTVEAM